jgi:hypothetical protein
LSVKCRATTFAARKARQARKEFDVFPLRALRLCVRFSTLWTDSSYVSGPAQWIRTVFEADFKIRDLKFEI